MARRSSKDKTIQIEVETTIDENGGTKREKSRRTIVLEQEPSYIKLYVNTLLAFRSLPKQMNALLVELLKHMTFANEEVEHGGQLIILNSFVKAEIVKRLGIKPNTLDQGLTRLVKAGILRRIGLGTYQGNPHMFGLGEWKDIRELRATFDFMRGTVEVDVESEPPVAKELHATFNVNTGEVKTEIVPLQ